MEKILGAEIVNPLQKQAYLEDNCDACEKKGYMKAYTPEELQGYKENLANLSIEIADLENEMKKVVAEYKGKLKPLKESRVILVSNIRAKAEYVNEECYKFIDHEAGEVGYYNRDGILVESRLVNPEEKQITVFGAVRQMTGTDN